MIFSFERALTTFFFSALSVFLSATGTTLRQSQTFVLIPLLLFFLDLKFFSAIFALNKHDAHGFPLLSFLFFV